VDKFLTTECRASAGTCDVAETCTGLASACPANLFAANTTTCTGALNGGACDGIDKCLGTANTCVDKFLTTECRASAGTCDVAETCTGLAGACPADGFALASVHCTGASQTGLCDNNAADHCSGTANTCVDVFKASTVECRASADQCDVAEKCTLGTAACPVDGFKSNGTTCDDGTACTQTDNCDGNGTCVGSNLIQCTADQCHIPPTCNSNTGKCPNPTNKPDGTGCEDGSLCTSGETCTAGQCGSPTFTVTCTAPGDDCREAAVCNPATGSCFNPNKANGSACGDPFSCRLEGNCELGNCVGGRLGDDLDRDGVCDFFDNCDSAANPNQADDDGDAIGNDCDNCPQNYNPNQNNLCGLPAGAAHLPSLFLKQVQLKVSKSTRTLLIKGILDTTEAGGLGGLTESFMSGKQQPTSPQNTGFSVNLTGSSLTMPGEIMIFPPCPTVTTCTGTRGEKATFRLKGSTNRVVLTITAANRLFAPPFSADPVKVTLAYGAPDANDIFHFDRRDQIPAPSGGTTLGNCALRLKGNLVSCRK
jgi:hypothetical protein